jgi:hypothetical protein
MKIAIYLIIAVVAIRGCLLFFRRRECSHD